MTAPQTKTFFITGVSSGLGRAFAEAACYLCEVRLTDIRDVRPEERVISAD